MIGNYFTQSFEIFHRQRPKSLWDSHKYNLKYVYDTLTQTYSQNSHSHHVKSNNQTIYINHHNNERNEIEKLYENLLPSSTIFDQSKRNEKFIIRLKKFLLSLLCRPFLWCGHKQRNNYYGKRYKIVYCEFVL